MTIDDNHPRFQDRDIEHSPYSNHQVVVFDPEKIATWKDWVNQTAPMFSVTGQRLGDIEEKFVGALFPPKPQVLYVDSVSSAPAIGAAERLSLKHGGIGLDMSSRIYPLDRKAAEEATNMNLRDYQLEVIRLMSSYATMHSLPANSQIRNAVNKIVDSFVKHDTALTETTKRVGEFYLSMPLENNHEHNVSAYLNSSRKQHFSCVLYMEPRQLRSSSGVLRFYKPSGKIRL